MLQTLRDKTSGWIATAIVALLVVPFAFFGMEQYLFQRNDTFVAKIEAPPTWWPAAPAVWPLTMLWQRDEISVEEFRGAFERVRQQQRQQQGEQFDARQFESVENKRKVLDGLVDQHVLALSADREGIAASDSQVREQIEAIPAFQVDGKFDPQRYQLALASQAPARTPREFEQEVRKGLQEGLMPSQVRQTAFATAAELHRIVTLLGQKRDVGFAILPPPVADTASISAGEIQQWYDRHLDAYRAPETVSIDYVDVNGQSLAATAAVPDEAALRQRYDQEKSRFVESEQRSASHILIKVDANASPAVQQAAQARAAALAKQAQQPGADFAALARANSDDTGSKAAGGDLGWVARDVMAKPFEDALFAMHAGEIRGPVKTSFGWHVIQLREVKPGKQVPFEQARDQLVREQADADLDRGFNDLIGKLVDQINKNPTTLAPAARVANLPVLRAGPFARGQGTGIAANMAVQRSAFSESMIEDGSVSDPIELAPDHSVLIRVSKHTPEHQLPLAQVSQRVIAAIRGDRAAKAQAAVADSLVARLRAGTPLKQLATEKGLVSSDVPAVPRGAPIPDKASADAVFEVPPPAAGKVSAGKAITADGRLVVFAVSRVIPGNPGEATPEQQAGLRQQLAQMYGEVDEKSLVDTLRGHMRVTVAEERL